MLDVANEDFSDKDKIIKQMKGMPLSARTVHNRTSCGGNTIEGYKCSGILFPRFGLVYKHELFIPVQYDCKVCCW